MMAAEVGEWHGGFYRKAGGRSPLDEPGRAARFEAIRAKAKEDIIESRLLVQRVYAEFKDVGVPLTAVSVGDLDPVRGACGVVEAAVCMKPLGKCDKCSFFRAKLAGLESLLYSKSAGVLSAQGGPAGQPGFAVGTSVLQFGAVSMEPTRTTPSKAPLTGGSTRLVALARRSIVSLSKGEVQMLWLATAWLSRATWRRAYRVPPANS